MVRYQDQSKEERDSTESNEITFIRSVHYKMVSPDKAACIPVGRQPCHHVRKSSAAAERGVCGATTARTRHISTWGNERKRRGSQQDD